MRTPSLSVDPNNDFDQKHFVSDIGNGYGSLITFEEKGKYYWGINGYGAVCWEEISLTLYKAIQEH